MLQRIQTLFLLISTVLLILLFCFPMAVLPEGAVQYSDSPVLFGLLLVATIVAFFSIFLYRHRMLQIRVSFFNILILCGLQALIIYYYLTWPGARFSFTAVFPIVAVILTFLAIRYIGRDEAMVRAADRLRK